jgi:hypothetical protein
MRVAIMQPTYLPWAGYFDLISSVDLFIFLDNVQFDRRSWQQRNRIKTADGVQWLTVPVYSKGLRHQLLKDVAIDYSTQFITKHQRTIRQSYQKAEFFSDQITNMNRLIEYDGEDLASYNTRIIQQLMSWLEIETDIARASELNGSGNREHLLASLCADVQATEYVSPPGSRSYLQDSQAFKKLGIQVSYFDFLHPVYPQLHGPFVSHLSIIDMMFNLGSGAARLFSVS